MYKDLPTTKSLLFGIYDSLSINREGQTGKVEVDLMVLHIDYALVNLDFGTAYELGKQVFEICQEAGQHMMKALGDEHWLTFYQMGKFVDPNWVDNEIPTEIIVLQMSILGRLLEVAPLMKSNCYIAMEHTRIGAKRPWPGERQVRTGRTERQ